jgi:hypothetical protein
MDNSVEQAPRAPAETARAHALSPVFIHSSFRVSSTWIWWRFRQSQDVVAYCEVFHEGHAELDAAHLCAGSYKSWNSAHPESAPYNLEYLPLLDQTGRLATYDASMAFDLFMPTAPDRSITEAEARHIQALIDNAAGLGRTPVITDVRTLGRVHGLRRRFGGFHVLWYRDLFRQWCSYSGQALSGNPYFNNTVSMVLERNRHDRFLAALGEMFPLEDGATRPDDPFHFQRFVLLHLYLYVSALPDCDVAISADRLAATPAYRLDMTERLRAGTGIPVDLSGCRANIELSILPLEARGELMEAVRIVAGTIPSFLPGWSEAQALFLRDLLDDLEAEMDRYAFYTGKLRTYVSRGFKDLPACRAALESLPGLREERDRLAAGQADLLARREQADQERAALMAAQARIAAERDTMAAQRDAVAGQRDVIAGERDAMARERDAAGREKAELAEKAGQEMRALRQERDRLAAERVDLLARREQADQERAALMAAQARIAAERDAMAAQRDAVAGQRDVIAGERDAMARERDAAGREKAELAEKAGQEMRALRQERDQLRLDLANMRASTSWRISRPVRAFGRLLGRSG